MILRSGERRLQWLAGALLALLAPALLGSYTRSAWIGTFVGFTVLVAFTRARWLSGLAALVLALVLFLPAGYRERATSIFDPKSHWNVERLFLWDAGWRIFREHSVTGVGLQDLRPWVERYRSPEAHEPPHGHMHNIYLQVAVTMGIVGLVALAALMVGLFRTAGRGLRGDLRAPPDRLGVAIRLAAVASLAGFFTAGLFEWNFGDEELLDLLFVLVGMAAAASEWGRGWHGARR
jgi:O-antigen ligase